MSAASLKGLPGPFWRIPMEMVRACAKPAGQADLVRLAMKDRAFFQPHAMLVLNEDGFSAICTFEQARYPGQKQEVVVGLIGVAQENAL